jgi:hypothetical protein
MKPRPIMKGLLAVVCCLILINVIPHASATSDHFTNSTILIVGKCNTTTTPALWLFGFKWMHNKNVLIQARGGAGEQLNAVVLLSQFGVFAGYENIAIQLYGAKGLFFWGEKSLLLQKSSQRIFALCKATDIWVDY